VLVDVRGEERRRGEGSRARHDEELSLRQHVLEPDERVQERPRAPSFATFCARLERAARERGAARLGTSSAAAAPARRVARTRSPDAASASISTRSASRVTPSA
jgi:hypothetical protein